MMKLFVYPHDLAVGSSQINATDMAAAAAAAGHEVVVYGNSKAHSRTASGAMR